MMSKREPKVLTTPQVAELLGWSREYVRKGMARNGIREVRGWPEDAVNQLADQIRAAGSTDRSRPHRP